jgi:hypothetical protein
MMSAVSISPDGTIAEHEMPLDRSETLRFTCRVIGCQFVDVVRLTSVLDMWIDDEGLYSQPVNPAATALARHYGYTWQPYHGTALLCSANADGDSVGLTGAQVRGLLARLSDVAEAI